ncbi:MAG TPA: ABC transporter permease, partial [Gemmatimonadaceae bacterium]|nr:ABC transporter permease [Gemmatimonadaceae bacterium]
MPETPRRRRHRRFLGPDPRRDVDEELAFHFSMRVEELQRAGLTAAEAEAAAARRFGNVRRVREECAELADRRAARQRRRFRLDALRRDVRFALRTVATHRGFAAVVALTIALGIGANSAVFSVAYGVLLRPLPFRDADALVRLWSRNAPRGVAFFSVSPADYADWRAQGRAFSAMAAFERQRDATLRRAGGGVESVQATAVTPDVFPLLGTPALRGRTLLAADARPDAPPVAVLGHALWVTRFGADPAVLGSVVTLDGTPHTVVGVMPPRFAVPGTPAELWTPLSLATASTDHSNRYLRVLARLAPGRTLAEGRAELDLVAARLARAHPATNAGWSVNVMSVPEMIVGTQFRQAVVALVGVVAVVLLIACANAANLLLARAAARRRELALRRALGATRGRLVTQLLTESVVLATIGGVAGLALAYAGVAILRAAGAGTVPRLEDVRLDTPVLVFTAAVTLGSAVLFGLLPSLRVSRADMGATLRTGGRGVGHDGIGQRLRGVLVVLQVSLSLVLLVGTGLLLRSLARLQGVPLGFEPRGVLVAPLQLPEAASGDSTRRAAFQTALLARVGSLPGVEHAALVSSAPFAGPNTGLVFAREDRPTVAREQAPDADLRVVTPGYFRTIGLRLLRGR